jgi:membrane protein DedA with SNARE-associated domain
MDLVSILSIFGIYLGALIIGFICGFIPVGGSEVFLVAITLLLPKGSILPILLIILLMVAGQMAAKSIFYFGGKGLIKVSVKKNNKAYNNTAKKFKKWGTRIGTLIFLSAAIGIPPFFLTSFLSGSFKINYFKFLFFGSFGWLIRFSAIIIFPYLFKTFIL